MELTIYKKIFKFRSFHLEPIELSCNGEGTERDPAIIKRTHRLPDIICIEDSQVFIQFTNCMLKTIEISDSENISVVNSKINSIRIVDSMNIKLYNCKIGNSSWFHNCQKFKIENSQFKDTLEIDDFHNNYMKNCFFERIRNYFSSNNVFENCGLDENDMIKLISKKRGITDTITLTFLLLSIFLFFMIVNIYFSKLKPSFIIFPFIIIILLAIFAIFTRQSKIKKLNSKPSNIIK